MTPSPDANTALTKFTKTAEAVSGDVITAYSTSFGLATRLLGKRHRGHVRNVYALVRVADEIVDGVTSEAGLDPNDQLATLDRYEAETERAVLTGYSTDLVIHAFARTARATGIDASLTAPFFASMRADLRSAQERQSVFTMEDHAAYVYGSAEVVGLMCLRIFTHAEHYAAAELTELEHGARELGAAFQNINFLRDLGDDTARLRRDYLASGGRLSAEQLQRWVRLIRTQLADANRTIPLLPRDARAAVRSAHALFSELTDRVARTPVGDLYETRVRVPNLVKASLATRAILHTALERRS